MIIAELADEVRRLAGEFPERKAGCSYYNEVVNKPCCILGEAAFNVIDGLEYNPGANRKAIYSKAAQEWLGITMDDINRNYSAYRFLCEVQQAQDATHNWSESVRKADEYVERFFDGAN